MRIRLLATACCAVLAALTACGTPDPDSEPQDATVGDTGLTVVTSIDVYADLIEHIAEDTVEVEAIVTSTAVDPHSYEASPQDRLLVENADVVVANGGGYDSFITLLASAANKEDQVYQLIDGENTHSHDEHGEYENEHIWYDLDRMIEFVEDFADYLGEAAPDNTDFYTENASDLVSELDQLRQRNAELEASELSYLATEAVSGYLLDDAGLENLTEPEFLSAVEHGDDVSPRLYRSSLELAGEADVLSYNPQTETQQSGRIRAAAEDAGTVVVEFTETIPDDASGYLEWMDDNIVRLSEATEQARG